MNLLTANTLAACTGATMASAMTLLDPINIAIQFFDISNPERLACFCAQIGEESDGLLYSREIWAPTLAQKGYEGRKDLGNTQPGDGFRFRGAGLIETTGRYNFARTRDGMRGAVQSANVPDFELYPDALATPQWAAMSAGWFWQAHGCNELADAGNFVQITKRVNGGLNGEARRVSLWSAACATLGAAGGIEVTG